MASESQQNVVLLPIKPKYANAIFSGEKKVEFRKRQFKRPVSHVVVYSSSPEKKILGYFELGKVDVARPMTIWRKHKHAGGISFEDYSAYFEGKSQAVAYEIKKVFRLDRPVTLSRLRRDGRAPQSYCYLSFCSLEKLKKMKR